jgi:spore coat protein U-like protein
MAGLGYWAFAFAAMLAAALFAVPTPASAGINGCAIDSASIIFSPYDTQTKAAVDGAGSIQITCTGDGSSNSLSLNLSGGFLNQCNSRQMRSGSNGLNYQIYQDASRTVNFCDAGGRLDFNLDFTSGSSQTRTFTMYGRVLAAQNPVFSATYSDSLAVSIKKGGNTIVSSTASVAGSVAAICSVSAGTLGFGTYSFTTAALATAAVSVNCSNGATYQVAMSGGANLSGTTRRMAGPGAARLTYQLFSNSARTTSWGDDSALGSRVAGTGSGSAQALTVYGRIPAGQSVVSGSYTDSVVVTVEY